MAVDEAAPPVLHGSEWAVWIGILGGAGYPLRWLGCNKVQEVEAAPGVVAP